MVLGRFQVEKHHQVLQMPQHHQQPQSPSAQCTVSATAALSASLRLSQAFDTAAAVVEVEAEAEEWISEAVEVRAVDTGRKG